MEVCAESQVLKTAASAKLASAALASSTPQEKQVALLAIAKALETNADKIAAENARDLEAAKAGIENGTLSDSLYQRLKLDKEKILTLVTGIKQIAEMPDPLAQKLLARELDHKLNLYKVTCPIGVVAVIFESRPEAMPQILSLCLKTGNALILKGGAEAEKSNRILFDVLQNAAVSAGIPAEAFALIETRADVKELLGADHFVDLIIPRGSNKLVRYIKENTQIPVLGHADGICHIYVDEEAELEMAIELILDSKTQYPSACNSVETLLVHKAVAPRFLAPICTALQKKGVELRLDHLSLNMLQSEGEVVDKASLDLGKIKTATDEDWQSEYCDLILSVKLVESMEDAIKHINTYGSGHTECMVSTNRARFQRFFDQVNSAGVYLNASTRFADGFRYGFGAELGISTSKLHPRGPLGVEGLITYKYCLLGEGQIVADYSGPNAKQFTHRELACEDTEYSPISGEE